MAKPSIVTGHSWLHFVAGSALELLPLFGGFEGKKKNMLSRFGSPNKKNVFQHSAAAFGQAEEKRPSGLTQPVEGEYRSRAIPMVHHATDQEMNQRGQ